MYNSIVLTFVFFISMEYSSAYVQYEDLGDGLLKLASNLHNICIKKTGTDDAAIENLRNGNFEDDDRIKKYVACLWLESNIVGPDGIMNMQLMEDLCPPKIKETGPKTVRDCWKQVEGVTPVEEKLYEMQRCFYKTNPEDFVIF